MFIFTQGIAGKEQQAVELSSSFINTSIYSTGKSKPFSNEDLVDTRSPSPRFYRLITITHKFKITRGTSLRSVQTRGTDLTSGYPPHHNHNHNRPTD